MTRLQVGGETGPTYLVAASDATDKSKNMADYICTGTADEVQIEAAIAALPAAGGTVILSEGTFNTATLLDIDSANTWLRGQGKQATQIVIGTGLQFGIDIGASHVTLSDLWIYTTDGNTGNYATGTHCVTMDTDSLTNITFSNVLFENARDGVKWWGNSKLKFENCEFLNVHNGCGNLAYMATLSQDIIISQCLFDDNTATSITLNPSKNVVISDCIFIGNGVDDACRVDVSSLGAQTENVLIDNCAAHTCGLLESATPTGGADPPGRIQVSNCSAYGFWDFPAIQGQFEDLLVSNCEFISSDFYAINIVRADRLKMSNVLVDLTGYTTVTPNIHSISLALSPNAQLENVTVISSGIATGNCLYIASTSTNVRVVNSEFKDSLRRGINIAGDEATIIGCLLDNNAQDGIWVEANDALISGCFFSDNGQQAANTYDDVAIPAVGGLRVLGCRFEGTNIARHYDEASATGDPCMVMDNDFDGTPGTAAVRVQKTGSIVRNNFGWVTENSGTGSITAAVTTDVIAHGLSVTPTVADISITLAEDPTNTPGAIWVDTIGAANLTVNCENVPGASNLDFGWRAVVL